MAGTSRLALGVFASLLLIVSSADAFGGRFGIRRSSAYYSVPSTSGFWLDPNCLPLPKVLPVPDAGRTQKFATPTTAPPSPTAEPPLQKKTSNDPRMPVITTAHSLPSGFVPGAAPLPKERCRVGFWNLSGREVTLTVDGKTWTLTKDRSLTLDLDRQFAWQIAGQALRVERVPEGQAAQEVLIRD
ncbi:MAG: hypothetical protein EXR98_21370 [Gemmataceae bacterium]|nr:hypothetical protein [Gemmataceae bacterium]